MAMSLAGQDNGAAKDQEPDFHAANGRSWPASVVGCLCVVLKYGSHPSFDDAELLHSSGGRFSLENFADCLSDGQAYPSLKDVTTEETSAFSSQVAFEFDFKWLHWADGLTEDDVIVRFRYLNYLFEGSGNGEQGKKKFDGWMKMKGMEYEGTELGFQVKFTVSEMRLEQESR